VATKEAPGEETCESMGTFLLPSRWMCGAPNLDIDLDTAAPRGRSKIVSDELDEDQSGCRRRLRCKPTWRMPVDSEEE